MLEAIGEWKIAMEREVGEEAEAALIVSMDEVAEIVCSLRRRAKGMTGLDREAEIPGVRGEPSGV